MNTRGGRRANALSRSSPLHRLTLPERLGRSTQIIWLAAKCHIPISIIRNDEPIGDQRGLMVLKLSCEEYVSVYQWGGVMIHAGPLAFKVDRDGQGAVIFASYRVYRRSVQ